MVMLVIWLRSLPGHITRFYHGIVEAKEGNDAELIDIIVVIGVIVITDSTEANCTRTSAKFASPSTRTGRSTSTERIMSTNIKVSWINSDSKAN